MYKLPVRELKRDENQVVTTSLPLEHAQEVSWSVMRWGTEPPLRLQYWCPAYMLWELYPSGYPTPSQLIWDLWDLGQMPSPIGWPPWTPAWVARWGHSVVEICFLVDEPVRKFPYRSFPTHVKIPPHAKRWGFTMFQYPVQRVHARLDLSMQLPVDEWNLP